MKIRELIVALNEFDPDMEVILSADSEGNKFSPAAEATPQKYVPESTWDGYLVFEEEDDYEDDEEEYEEEDVQDVVVIWPTN